MSDDDDSRKQKATVIGGCCCLLLALAGGLIGCSFGIVGINEVGLDFDSIAVVVDDSKLFENGRFFIGLGHGFLLYPTYLMTVEFKKAGSEDIGWDTDKSASGGVLACASKDGQQLDIELSYFVRIDTSDVSNVVNLYNAHKFNYLQTLVQISQDAIKGTSTQFNTYEYFQNRTAISEAFEKSLSATLQQMYMTVHSVQLRDIQLTAGFETAIEDKIVSAQRNKTMTETGLALQVRADTSVAVSRADAEIKVLQAEAGATAVSALGEASAGATKTLIDADATALQGLKSDLLQTNAELLQYLWIETLADASSSKLLIGLNNNPAIVST
jgi:regulator of protease activity HflC (stomatin/prohibitin superfamily)